MKSIELRKKSKKILAKKILARTRKMLVLEEVILCMILLIISKLMVHMKFKIFR